MSDRPGLTRTPEAPRLGAPAHGLHDRRTLDRLLVVLVLAGAALIGAGLLVEKHPYFAVEHWTGFHALVGAGFAALAVLVAVLLGRVVRRPEGYYDR